MTIWTKRLMIILALISTVLLLVSTIVYIRSSNKEDHSKPNVFQNTTKFEPDQQVIENCSTNEPFCIKVDNYPKKYLSDILRTSEYKSTSYFGTDNVTNVIQTKIYNTNLEDFCESKEDVIFPEAGVTKNNEWRYIIQDLKINEIEFRQGIRVEKCTNPGNNCKFNYTFPQGFKTTCEQKYIYKKMVAYKGSKELYYESFKLPSCCVCMYSKI